jgi:hypothetical protein
LSNFSNDRTDEYGGSLENRMRIVLRTIEAVRAEVGPDYLVGMNLQGHDFSPRGLEPSDAQKIAAALSATGAIDYIIVKAATYYEAHQNVPDMQHAKALWAPLAAAVREAVQIPVIAVGRISDAHDAERILREGAADMVAMTRQQIADPETVNKIRAGRLRDIRPCIGCNQGCIDRLFDMQHSSCVHNPAAGYELELGAGTLRRADPAGHVVVVGAGPAGMKAAEVAARRGHRVTLLERRPVTGGQLRLAAKIRGRAEIGGVIDHLDRELGKLGVDIRCGIDLGVPEIMALDATHVIVATGSAPNGEIIGNRAQGIMETPGLRIEHVLSVWDVLEEDREIGRRVMIVDDGEGSWKSVGLALDLDSRQHEVEFVTPLSHAAAKLGPFSGQLAMKRLFQTDIKMRAFTTLLAVEDHQARLLEQGKQQISADLDNIILAGWHAPVTDRYFELKAAGATVTRIGDAVASRTMMEAVHEGERTARNV